MSKIITCGSPSALGATFVCWSLHYLAGHTHNYSVKHSRWFEVPDNPMEDGINAHKFQKNHPGVFDDYLEYVQELESINDTSFHTVYPAGQRWYHVDSSQEWFDEKRYQLNTLYNYCGENNMPVIWLDITKAETPYFYPPRDIPRSEQEHADTLIDDYLSDGVDQWASQLANIWDKREYLALGLRPFEFADKFGKLDMTWPHYYLPTVELYTQLDKTIVKILDYCEIETTEARMLHWKKIYNQWQDMQLEKINWVWNLDYIIDSIVNNRYLDLRPYNLRFFSEVIILHILMYKYGLNLRAEGLEKFPHNTQQLHALLEPNIHQIEPYELPL